MNAIERGYREFCEERFPQATPTQVAELESRLGVGLPPDYRQFLLDYNGGYFREPRILPPVENCPLDRLTFLCGVGATDDLAELASPEGLGLFDDNDPCEVLPIGYTLMGNLLFLITHPEDRGHVGLKKAFSDDSFFLAEGIVDFFALLREPTED